MRLLLLGALALSSCVTVTISPLECRDACLPAVVVEVTPQGGCKCAEWPPRHPVEPEKVQASR